MILPPPPPNLCFMNLKTQNLVKRESTHASTEVLVVEWLTDMLSLLRFVLKFYLKLVYVCCPGNMEDGICAPAICEPIYKMRKVYMKRPFEKNILKVAADMSGLFRVSV